MTENGRCLTIPVSLAGLTVTWCAALLLITIGTVGDVEGAAQWGLLCSAAAASWTVIYGLARQRRMLVHAFELGRESARQDVVPLR